MKKIPALLAVIGLSVLLFACPYKSDVGIDDGPSIKMNKDLLGTWHKASYPADSTEMTFMKSTNQKYLLAANTSDGEGSYSMEHYEVWLSKAGSTPLVTLYNTGSKKYCFGELELGNDKLSIKLLSEDITTQQFTTVADMKKFIESIYAEGRALYDTDVNLSDMLRVK